MKYFQHAAVVQETIDNEGAFTAASVTLDAILATKKTGTISKRASSLKMYAAWFVTAGLAPSDFFSEPAVFRYVAHLHSDKAPATRAAALREAINFVGGTFNIDVAIIRASGRIRGMTCKLLRTRGAVRQRRPLTTKMVIALENVLADNVEAANADAIHAGTALFAVFSRARVGDLRRCGVEPLLDLTDDKSSGYIETRFTEHKTARPGSRRSLPIVASAYGLTDICWGNLWLRARSAAGVSASASDSLTPALGVDRGWLDVAYLTPEFAAAFRRVLLNAGFTTDDLENVGAHSLKVTCLSWCAKFGLDRETRRMLGYHALPGDSSMDAYSRAPLAGPLRQLDTVLQAIRAGTFVPDATSSGTFPRTSSTAPPSPPSASKPLTPKVSSPTSSSSSSSSSSSTSAGSLAEAPKDDFEWKIILNITTGFAHAMGPDLKLFCGKAFPKKNREVDALATTMRLCRKCKRRF